MSIACYFDCDGTLVEYDAAYAEVFAAACDRADVAADPAVLLGSYDEPFFEAFAAFDPDPYREGAAAAFEAHGVDADPGRFAEALRAVEVERSVVRPGTRETLDRVADDHAVGVLTNGLADQQRRKLERHDLFDVLDAYVPSYEVGAHKPDPAVFEAARERLSVDEYVYVGDSPEHDIEPAGDAGFHAVRVDPEAATVTVPDVGSLGRLVDLF